MADLFFQPLTPEERAAAAEFSARIPTPKRAGGGKGRKLTAEQKAKMAAGRARWIAAGKPKRGKGKPQAAPVAVVSTPAGPVVVETPAAKPRKGSRKGAPRKATGRAIGAVAGFRALRARLRAAKPAEREKLRAEIRAARRPKRKLIRQARNLGPVPRYRPVRKQNAIVRAKPRKKGGLAKAGSTAKKYGKGLMGAVERAYDKHPNKIKAVVFAGSAVGAVKLNQMYPEGVGPVEASTAAAGAAFVTAAVAHYGFKAKRTTEVCITAGVGMLTGTATAALAKGEKPFLKGGPKT